METYARLCKRRNFENKCCSLPPFFQAEHSGHIHAFATYFSASFSHCNPRRSSTKAGFSNSPFEPATCWKQTVFYNESVLEVVPGTKVQGMFRVSLRGLSLSYSVHINGVRLQRYRCITIALGQKFYEMILQPKLHLRTPAL